MANLDRNALWSAGHDESVEVNQRALIDKVLARYSGEFTVFRELLQNSDDAASKAVEIRFETKRYLDDIKTDASAAVVKRIDLKQPVHQWTFRNNGITFREEDWSRLKKIAEGNPDEEKIGAFGVGFYSLFSVTEEPFVKSGDKWMGFYWKDKKDQLFARRGNLPDGPEDVYRQWTTFEMELREPAPMPTAFDFIRFLTSSITFMAHLENVTVWYDGHRIANLNKDRGVPKQIRVPSTLQNKSDSGMMTMNAVKTTSLHISAEVMRLVYTGGSEKKLPPRADRPPLGSSKPANTGFFSSLFSSLSGSSGASPVPPPVNLPEPVIEMDQMTPISSHVDLSIFSGEVGVTLSQKMITELHRSTKKNPPNRLWLEIIYTGKDEYDASKKEEEGMFEKTGSLFHGLRADLDGIGSARIFIGHATAQTTGIGGHMSARFIPTVERESIDLVDRNVAIWNKELLFIGGVLCRVAYEMELSNVRNLWTGASEGKNVPEQVLREWLQDRCLHALQFFTFQVSTPSPIISNLLEATFFSCSLDGSFPIISTAGVLDARNVRLFDPAYAGFMKSLPVLPEVVISNARFMVEMLRGRGMLKEVAFTDVLTELRSRPLTEAEMVECLKWRIDLNTDGIRPSHMAELRREFLHAAVFSTADGMKGDDHLIVLESIKTVHIPRNATTAIPIDGPFPEHTLPYSVSRQLKAEALLSLFGWTELTIPLWLQHLLSPSIQNGDPGTDLTRDALWAEKVLGVLARAWPSLPREDQEIIVGLLRAITCIPTILGMKEPSQSYFLNANVFPDLPIVTMPKGTAVKGPMEKLMLALGVQQHVDLQIVFKRMIQTGDWDMHDLIRYLVAVESSLTVIEMDRLRETVAFSKEDVESPTAGSTAALPRQVPKTRYRAKELYEPSPTLRELGLPILAWGTTPKWRSSSDEAKFLFKLGLKRYPTLKDVLSLAAGENPNIRKAALNYFIQNASTKYPEYNPDSFASLSYIPAQKPDGTIFMGKPTEVFIDRDYSAMGFSIVHASLPADWATTLKLPKTPPIYNILPILKDRTPRDPLAAKTWFELLSGRLSDFTTKDLQYLSNLDFIPTILKRPLIQEKEGKEQISMITMLSPNKCYLNKQSSTGFHSQIFSFVDFGTRANSFLMACGVRTEPTVEELTQILIADPRKFYDLSGGYDNFIVELRNIAVNFHGISTSTRSQMKRTACLIASRKVARTLQEKRLIKKADDDSDGEDEKKTEHDLLVPNQIAIVDDMATHTMFDSVYTAPQEDLIEGLYRKLGSLLLSSVVREEYKPSADIKDSARAPEMRRLVLERLPLFLHERTHGRTILTYTWLNAPGNFFVKEVGKLTLVRTLNFGKTKAVKTQEVSATASRQGNGPVQLWIAGNSQVDLYEVSHSLCRVILEYHKPNDSLLFMTILSTDLRALRRRGFNVDRVLRQQKAEQEQQLITDTQAKASMEDKGPSQEPQPSSSSPKLPSQQSLSKIADGADPKDALLSTKNLGSFLSNIRNKLQKPLPEPLPPTTGTPPPPMYDEATKPQQQAVTPQTSKHDKATKRRDPMSPYSQGPQWNTEQGVTPHANIERNVKAAIEGCRAENNAVVNTRASMTKVKEAMNEGYCDTMNAINLDLVGVIGRFKVYTAANGPPSSRTAMELMRPAIIRFGDQIILPLIKIYNIPSSSVQIFHDWSGPLIAFNRNGSLFLNLRYYIAWHDLDVQNGRLAQAYTSWYFSLAHEIAHNIIHPHNSEHEFYFSTICEHHMIGFSNLLHSARDRAQ